MATEVVIDPEVSNAIMKYGFAAGGHIAGLGDEQSKACAEASAGTSESAAAALTENPRTRSLVMVVFSRRVGRWTRSEDS